MKLQIVRMEFQARNRGEFLMNEPFIFRVSDCYYIQASYPSPAEHRHFAAHLVFAMGGPSPPGEWRIRGGGGHRYRL